MSAKAPHDNAAEALCEAGAVFAQMFASGARRDHRHDSDIDGRAWWEHDVPAVWDVAVPDGVGLVALNTAPLELAGRIALEGVVAVAWVARL